MLFNQSNNHLTDVSFKLMIEADDFGLYPCFIQGTFIPQHAIFFMGNSSSVEGQIEAL